MTSSTFPGTKPLLTQRIELAIQAMAASANISRLADEYHVSRKYVYQQKQKAQVALDEAFATKAAEDDVLFHLPVTKTWLSQITLCLTLVCHSSYRGVVEFMRDMLGVSISEGSVHNLHQLAIERAGHINRVQDLSLIRHGLLDEIFHCNHPVLAGIDAASTYCFLLAAEAQRDSDTWAIHLYDAKDQGFNPDYGISDAAKGTRAGFKQVFTDKACHGDVFHILHQCEGLVNVLGNLAQGATSRRAALEVKIQADKKLDHDNTLSAQLAEALQAEAQAVQLLKDIKLLSQWLRRDILELAGPSLATRIELFDFVTCELLEREQIDAKRIRPVRVALQNQRDKLLAFAGVLDGKLEAIAQAQNLSMYLVRQACELQRKPETSAAYWQEWCRLCAQMGHKCHAVFEAVINAMDQTPRCSSMVENLNSRLRNYFTLRRNVGGDYLNLLQFFLNHRTFLRSRIPERVGKSPKQLMTGQKHPHWLTLLGFGQLQPLQA
ncbi:MAG: hypothetical protein IPH35_24130 [Rhodoferax sp.]|nr:hypothetical protein [Rhodoferax sp.]